MRDLYHLYLYLLPGQKNRRNESPKCAFLFPHSSSAKTDCEFFKLTSFTAQELFMLFMIWTSTKSYGKGTVNVLKGASIIYNIVLCYIHINILTMRFRDIF